MTTRRFFTTRDMSQWCEVTIKTVVNWSKLGLLDVIRTPGGQVRITREEAVRFLNQFKYPLPDVLQEPPK